MADLLAVANEAKAKRLQQEAAAARKEEEEKKKKEEAALPNLTCDTLIYPLNWAYGIWVLCTVFGYAYLHFSPPELKNQFEVSGAFRSLKFAYVLQAAWFIISFRERLQMSTIVLVFISRQLYTSLELMGEMNLPVAGPAEQLQSVGQLQLESVEQLHAGEYVHPGLLVTVVMIHYSWAVLTTLQAFALYLVRTRFDWRMGLFVSVATPWLALFYSAYCVWVHQQYVFSLVTCWMLGAIYCKVGGDGIDGAGRVFDYGPGLAKVYRMELELMNVRVPAQIDRMSNVVTTTPKTVEHAIQSEIEASMRRVCLGCTLALLLVNGYHFVRTHHSDVVQLPALDLPEWMYFSSSWLSFSVACLLAGQATLTHSYTVYSACYQIYIRQVLATKQKEQ
jgi:hypothetical protein